MGRPTVELDLDPAHARDLTAGGVFVTGCALGITEECNLVVRGAAGEMPLVARVVFVDPSGRGAGLEVVGFNSELRTRIAELAASSAAAAVVAAAAAAPARVRPASINPATARARKPSIPPAAIPPATIPPAAIPPAAIPPAAAPPAAIPPAAAPPAAIPPAAAPPKAAPPAAAPPAAAPPKAAPPAAVPPAAVPPAAVPPVRARTPSPVAAPAPPKAPPPAPAIAITPELEPEPEPARATTPVAVPVFESEPEPEPDSLDLQPEHYTDVSAGSAFDIPADPGLNDLPTYELETDLDLDATPSPPPPADDGVTTSGAPPFDPDATEPLSLEEMADDDSTQVNAVPTEPGDESVDVDMTADADGDREASGDGEVSGDGEAKPESEAKAEGEGEGEAGEGENGGHALRLHERMRGLTLVQQLKYAHTGELQERILLERIYGKAVWEALLRNPRLTAQEVARIARMGALPRPLLEQIVGNGAWLQVPEVRRALLTHPRLEANQVIRILKLLPKHELKLAISQTAYPQTVREQARRMIRT